VAELGFWVTSAAVSPRGQSGKSRRGIMAKSDTFKSCVGLSLVRIESINEPEHVDDKLHSHFNHLAA
jgi:hypothetical protein